MPPFTKRALYTPAQQAAQREARSQWRRSAIGKVIEDVKKDYRKGTYLSGKLESTLEQFRRGGLQAAIGNLTDSSLNGLVADIVRYGRGPERNLVNQFLRSLGPAGKILSAIASAVGNTRSRPTTGDKDVDAARELLEAFGYTVSHPNLPPSSNVKQSVDAAKEFLEANGYEVREVGGKTETSPKPKDSPASPAAPPSETGGTGVGAGESAGGDGGMVDVPVGPGSRRFPKDHPIVTKEMVNAPDSSNVYSFMYDIDKRVLYIRFDAPKTKLKPDKRPGPLYTYGNFPPQMFLRMISAGSKGGFVWDNIRIRGTVSGHRYNYQLAAVREGYVPRKATMTADGEWFIKRTVNTINRKGVRKRLVSKPSAPVPRRFTNYPGQPNRGRPDRGEPDRGR